MQYITKKIENSYVVWFEESNRWIQFEEPAWYVNKLYQKGLDKNTISLKCAKKYQLDKEECFHFVTNICNGLREFSKPNPFPEKKLISPDFTYNVNVKNYSVRYYIIGGKRLIIKYNTQSSEYYIHLPLAHIETERFIGIADKQFEIISQESLYILRIRRNKESNCYFFEDFAKLKKRLFIEIANTIYNKAGSDWISFVHASALTDGKKIILLSSSSGSGKSSMAALMQTRGLQVVSDDFVPIDATSKKAHPFPAAISVKHGSFPLLSPHYGNLENESPNNHKSIRYLYPRHTNEQKLVARPVKSIVFIKYNPSIQCEFKKLSVLEALKLFHVEAWVSGNPQHARTFINWFAKLHFYNLEYSDSEKGMDKIYSVFEDSSWN